MVISFVVLQHWYGYVICEMIDGLMDNDGLMDMNDTTIIKKNLAKENEYYDQ